MIINFALWVVQMLPPHWRTNSIVVLLKSASVAFSYAQDRLEESRKSTAYELQHTSQTCYLRGVLNDAIDKYDRRITVEDIESLGFFYIYANNEPIDSVIDQDTQIFSKIICGVNSASFKVSIPFELYNQETINQATSIVKKYKTIGRSFIITSY